MSNNICNKCNTHLIWQSDFDAADIIGEDDASFYDVIIISYYYCPNCDSLHELWYKGNGSLVTILDN